jgi:hypothetical protein
MCDVTCTPNMWLAIWILLPPSTTSILEFSVASSQFSFLVKLFHHFLDHIVGSCV